MRACRSCGQVHDALLRCEVAASRREAAALPWPPAPPGGYQVERRPESAKQAKTGLRTAPRSDDRKGGKGKVSTVTHKPDSHAQDDPVTHESSRTVMTGAQREARRRAKLGDQYRTANRNRMRQVRATACLGDPS